MTTLNDATSTSLTLAGGSLTVANAPPTLPVLIITGQEALVGAFTANNFTLASSGSLTLNQGNSLTATTAAFGSGTVTLNSGTVTVTGDASFSSSLSVNGTGSFTVLGALSTAGGSIQAANSSRVELTTLDGTSGSLTLNCDSTATIEVGGQNVGAAGSITVDPSAVITESGNFTAPVIVDNGQINVADHTSLSLSGSGSLRGLTGSGGVNIGAGSALTLSGVDSGTSDTITINFSSPAGELFLSTNDIDALGNFKPTVSGFAATDVISFGGAVTSATYTASYLSLFNGKTLVAKLNIGTKYSSVPNTFSTVPVGSGTQIDYVGGNANPAPAGTAALPGHSFVWVGPVAGNWQDLTDWSDTTSAVNPVAYAPGMNDIVTINAAANSAAQVVIGDANAFGLTLNGETLLVGAFNVDGTGATGGLTLADGASAFLYAGSSMTVAGDATFGSTAALVLNGATMNVAGTFYANSGLNDALGDITVKNAGAKLAAASLVDNNSSYSITSGAVLSVAQNVSDTANSIINSNISSFAIDGGTFTVGGVFVSGGYHSDDISTTAGGRVQLAALQENQNGIGVGIYVDATSSTEIGTVGNATAGSITLDSGLSVTENGNWIAPTIIVKGALKTGASQTLILTGQLEVDGSVEVSAQGTLRGSGAITGAGIITIDAGAGFTLWNAANSSSTAKIAFNGAGGQLTLTNADLDSSFTFAPAITGFAASDVINFTGSTLTGVSASGNTLSLLASTGVVGSVSLVGNYAGSTFSVANNAVTVSAGGSAAPVIFKPASVYSGLNAAVAVRGLAVYDATNVARMSVTLSATSGSLLANSSVSGGGGSILGSGSKTLTLVGTTAQVDADLTTLQYAAATGVNDTIAISATNNSLITTTDSIPMVYYAQYPNLVITTPTATSNIAYQTVQGTSSGVVSGATIQIYDNGGATPIATSTILHGSWSANVTLNAGSNSLVATNTDASGTTLMSSPLVETFTPPPYYLKSIVAGGQTSVQLWARAGTNVEKANATIRFGSTQASYTGVTAPTNWTSTVSNTAPGTFAVTLADGNGTSPVGGASDAILASFKFAQTAGAGQLVVSANVTSSTNSQSVAIGAQSAGSVVTGEQVGLAGVAYDWKSHALLSGTQVNATGSRLPIDNGQAVLSFHDFHYDPNGNVVAELFADHLSGAQSFGLSMTLPSGVASGFAAGPALPSDWSVVANTGTPGTFAIAGMGTTGFFGSADIGQIAFSVPAGSTGLALQVTQDTVGATSTTPFQLSYAAGGTDGNGSFNLGGLSPDQYSASLARSTADSGRAITAADAQAALKLAVGLNPNQVSAVTGRAPLVSPYQLIAADVNGDGRVTALDAQNILRMAVGLASAPAPKWEFVSESTSYWNPGTNSFSVTSAAVPTSFAASGGVNMVGVLTGDVNGSWAPLDGNGNPLASFPTQPDAGFAALSTASGAPPDQWGMLSYTVPGAAAATGGGVPVGVLDSTANVAAGIDQLQNLASAGLLSGIWLTDAQPAVLSVTATQVSADAAAIAAIHGNYTTPAGGTLSAANGSVTPVLPSANAVVSFLAGSTVPRLEISGAPAMLDARNGGHVEATILGASVFQEVTGFAYGASSLGIDLAGLQTTDLVATDVLIGGAHAVLLGQGPDLTHGVAILGLAASQTAADLVANHISFTGRYALIG